MLWNKKKNKKKKLKLEIRKGGILGALKARQAKRKNAMDAMFPGEKKKE